MVVYFHDDYRWFVDDYKLYDGLNMENKLLTRDEFRNAVFIRDNHRCIIPNCNKPAVDAHHIIERSLWQDALEFGGYFMSNGASLCEEHHIAAEKNFFPPQYLWQILGISNPIRPKSFLPDVDYNKWGKPFDMPDRTRIKYPSTPYLPFSSQWHSPDDDSEHEAYLENVDCLLNVPLVLTIKMDGCFHYISKVTLSDGTKIQIGKMYEEFLKGKKFTVMSYNNDLCITEDKPVINIYKHNAIQDEWKTINIKRKIGNKIHVGTIFCTKNHEFWTDKGWICADDLTEQSIIYTSINEMKYEVKQFILGSLLGDASLLLAGNSVNPYFSLGHCKEQKELIELGLYLCKSMSPFYDEFVSGFGSKMFRFRTRNSPMLREVYDVCYQDNKKVPSEQWISKLDIIGLSVWYMDDGSLMNGSNKQRQRVTFATNGYTYEQCETIASILYKRWNFKISIISDSGRGFKLDMDSDSSERFFSMISPYVVKSMRYKLPSYLHDIPCFWDKYITQDMFSTLRKSEITKISTGLPTWLRQKFQKYDLEIEDNHNYFVEGILVHNSNIQMTNNHIAARNGSSADHISFDYLKALHAQNYGYLIPEGKEVFCEWLYAKHSIHYTGDLSLNSYLQVFGVYDMNQRMWGSWADVENIAKILGIPTVPVIKTAIYEKEWQLSNDILNVAQKVIKEGHEGVVVRVVYPFHYGQFCDHIAKFVRPNHVQTSKHWKEEKIIRNIIK